MEGFLSSSKKRIPTIFFPAKWLVHEFHHLFFIGRVYHHPKKRDHHVAKWWQSLPSREIIGDEKTKPRILAAEDKIKVINLWQDYGDGVSLQRFCRIKVAHLI